MQEISLKDAATDIVQTSRSWFDDDQKQVQRGKQQFFVIAGAGVSYPSIPLSREITEHCKQKAIADGRDRTYTSPDPINEYEHWMNAAYSQPDSRRQYFQTLIDEARISHATLRLVQLLDSHRVTDFVVTPNFDNLISRGLTRFGVEHIVCDHGATTQRIIQDRDDAVQIVHVHGSHWNYDICNLSSEIEHVAGATNPLGYPTGMLQLMQGLLASMSPIVVGYAGWENDVIMSALKDRCFVNDWRTNLYWCCYKREDADALPEWLKDHPRARLVMPDAGPSSHGDTGTGAEADAPAPPTGSTGGQPTPAASGKPATLDAAAVFEAIIERLNLNEPKITADPLSLFLEQLTADFPDDRETTGDDAPAAETDEFSWQSTIAAVKRAIALAEESDAQAKADPAEEIIDELRSALRRSQPQEIPGLIKRLGDADGLGKLDAGLKDSVASELMDLLQRPGRTPESLTAVVEAMKRIHDGDHPDVAKGLNSLAYVMQDLGRAKEAEPISVQSLEMYKRLFDGDHPDIARGLNNVAYVMQNLGRAEEAEPIYRQALEMRQRLFDGDHPDIARGLNNVAAVTDALGRAKEAEPIYRQALEMRQRLFDGDHPDIARSLNNVAYVTNALGRAEQAEPIYRQALEMRQRLFDGDHPDIATGLNNVAYVMHDLGRAEEAEPIYRQALEMRQRLFDGDHPDIAMSLNNVAAVTDALGRAEEAEPIYRQALEMRQRLFDGDHPDIARGIHRLASVTLDLDRPDEAYELCNDSLRMYRRLFDTDHPRTAGSLKLLAKIQAAQGSSDDAVRSATEAVEMARRCLPADHPHIAQYEADLKRLQEPPNDDS